MYETQALAKKSADSPFERIVIKRGDTGADDVEFDIKYCGICHSDVHVANDELQPFVATKYPCVPGHEVAGVVVKVGKNVKDIKVGDKVGVGTIVDACLSCKSCLEGSDNYCEKTFTLTFNMEPLHKRISTDLGYTLGGYSGKMTLNRRFVIKIPDSYPLEYAGPIFCSGITMYSPLKHWGAGKGGKRVGIMGIGGLGQMGIMLANKLGNEVTAISTTPRKEEMAKKIGAKHFVASTDPEAMAKAAKSLDLIIDTVSGDHNLGLYIPLLDRDGTIVCLGGGKNPHAVHPGMLIFNRYSVAGSACGSVADTQECIDFCAKHNLRPTIEIIDSSRIEEIFEKLSGKNDEVIRYVLDVQKSLK